MVNTSSRSLVCWCFFLTKTFLTLRDERCLGKIWRTKSIEIIELRVFFWAFLRLKISHFWWSRHFDPTWSPKKSTKKVNISLRALCKRLARISGVEILGILQSCGSPFEIGDFLPWPSSSEQKKISSNFKIYVRHQKMKKSQVVSK